MRKIVISSNTSWFVYNFRLNLIKTLQDRGYLIIVIAPFDVIYSKKLKEVGCIFYNIDIDNKGKNFAKDIKTFFYYLKLYKKISPTLAFHFTIKPVIYGSLATAILNIPTLNMITGLGTSFLKNNYLNKIVRLLYIVSQKRVKKIIFLNQNDQNIFLSYKLSSQDKSILLEGGEGVYPNIFKPMKKQKNREKFVFLFFGRLIYDKGIKEYIEAGKIVKKKYGNVVLQLLGFVNVKNTSTISFEDIKKWQKEEEIEYFSPTDDVRPYIANADCIVLPSYSEGTPLSLIEAMSMEKPIIATNVSGCRDVVENKKDGFLCKVKDVKDLSQKMIDMIEIGIETRKEMGRAGRKKVIKNFNAKDSNKKYIDIIERFSKPMK